jgi:hypothetical protein
MADQGSLNSAVQWVDFFTKVAPIALGAVLVAFTWLRKQTVFFPLYRLYQLVGGRKSFHNARLERHWQAYEDLNNINLWFGLGLRSSRLMHEFFAWLEQRKFTLEEVASCRPYFDANARELRIPSRRRRVSIGIFAFIWLIAFAVFGQAFAFQDKALIKVNKTGTWAWVESGEAYGVTYPVVKWFRPGASWHLDNSQCLFEDRAVPFDDQRDKDVICRVVLGNNNDALNDAVVLQHRIAAASYGLFMLLMVVMVYHAQRIVNAKALAERLAMRD